MNKDKLEKFIIDHREDFQTHTAPDHIWLNIAKQLDDDQLPTKRKSPFLYFISGIAASMILVVTAIFGFHVYQLNTNKNYKNEITMMREFQQKESDYVRLVNSKLASINEGSVDQSLEYDMLQLDAIYQELKAELMSSQSDNLELIISALISNYETKLEILKTMEEKQTETINAKENESLNI